MSLLMPLTLVGPLLMLATAVVALWSRGPLGKASAVLLVAGVGWASVTAWRVIARWWRGTKAPLRDP